MKYITAVLFVCSLTFVLSSCGKEGAGMPDPVGGDLPTHYIIFDGSSFSPVADTAVRNSTFTFVNHSGASMGIYSSDSIAINKQGIASNTSFICRTDTLGVRTIIYRLAGTPSISGSLTITP
jgi:hypothetical protein